MVTLQATVISRLFIVALTKCDKLNKTERTKRLSSIESELEFLGVTPEIIPVSSSNGEGIETLKNIIKDCVENEDVE